MPTNAPTSTARRSVDDGAISRILDAHCLDRQQLRLSFWYGFLCVGWSSN